MFVMKNKEGNLQRKVYNLQKKEELESKGYVVVSASDDIPETEVEVEKKELQDMKVSELKEYAKAHEIELDGASKKEDIIKAIQEQSAKAVE